MHHRTMLDETKHVPDTRHEHGTPLSRRALLTAIGTGVATASTVSVDAFASQDLTPTSAAAHGSELTAMSATRLAQLIRTGRVSSVEVVQAYLNRIDTVNP